MSATTAVCRFWLKGDFKYGEDCRYSHMSTPTSIQKPSKQQDRRPNYKQIASNRAMMRDTRKVLCLFEPSELEYGSDSPVKLIDYQFLASYNWSKSDEPAIFVPGCPALWTPPQLPATLPRDNGKLFMDQNAHRSPINSFDPFFKSLLSMHPTFNMDDISLVSDRNNLRKLFNFASNHLDRSFRIEVDIVYNTMFFTRWEQNAIQLITGSLNSGHGHEFEKAYTTFDDDLANSSGHHRIVQYKLGDMKCLVRYEADAYFDDSINTSGLPTTSTQAVRQLGDTDNDISTGLKSLSLNSKSSTTTSTPKKGLRVIPRGRLVAPSAVIEMKSRSKNVKMNDVIPQLWFSQTEHLFVGYHREGIIEQEPTRYKMAALFQAWETQRQEQLHKLLCLVRRIREAVCGTEGKRAIVVYDHAEKPRKMRVYGTDKKGLIALLGEEKKCWTRKSS